MRKRLLAILLASVFLFSSCISAAPDAPHIPTVPTRGYWDGRTFVSAYFGLRFDLPQGWVVASEDEIFEVMWWLDDAVRVEPGAHIPQEVFDALGEVSLPDMWAHESTFDAFDMFGGNAVMTMIGQLSQLFDNVPLSELDMLWEMAEQTQGNQWMEFVVGAGTIHIGAYNWYFADEHYISDWDVNQRILIRFDDGFVKLIWIFYDDSDTLQYILANFR